MDFREPLSNWSDRSHKVFKQLPHKNAYCLENHTHVLGSKECINFVLCKMKPSENRISNENKIVF